MPYEKLNILPGYYTEASKIDLANRFVNGNHVRFYKGFPRKVGGTLKSTPNTFLGLCRRIQPWVTLTDEKYIALGTNLKLYINSGGLYFDITPIRLTVNPVAANPFTTTMGSEIVTVVDMANGAVVGDFVTFSGATAVGGITIDGIYQIQSIIDANTYTIMAASPASSGATGGGSVVIATYQLSVGAADTTANIGWGAGPWGEGTWGTPRDSSGDFQYARTWSISPYGEDLVVSPRDGAIYRWLASDGLDTPAALVSAAPATNKYVLVSPEDRFTIAFGAFDGSESDPLLIRWDSQDDINDWTPTTTNTAGDKRLSDGNLIMTAVSTRGAIIISTDTTVYSMAPDSTFVFAFTTLGLGGVLSPNGMVENNGIVYWFGIDNIYIYDGTIQVLPCDVRDFVYSNLNTLQAYKIYAAVNIQWNEIWFLYPDNNSNENNRYVAVNYLDGSWHYGSWVRTAWADKGVVTNEPIATDANGNLLYHETGTDDDGVPLVTSLTTGNIQIQDRNKFAYIKKIIPNFKSVVGNTSVAIQTQLYPQSNPQTSQAYIINSSTTVISTRARGDEFSLTFASGDIGVNFWMGNVEIEYIATGVR